jgi:hypothetical protein
LEDLKKVARPSVIDRICCSGLKYGRNEDEEDKEGGIYKKKSNLSSFCTNCNKNDYTLDQGFPLVMT